MSTIQTLLIPYKNLILLFSVTAILSTSLLLIALLRLAQILPQPRTTLTASQPSSSLSTKSQTSLSHQPHLLIVLGSGGHTAEILNILSSTTPPILNFFPRRTYLITSGDSFSASKAVEFEKDFSRLSQHTQNGNVNTENTSSKEADYSIVTVRRARRVHQSFWTSPYTALLSLWDCIAVLRGTHGDLVEKKDYRAQVTESGQPQARAKQYPQPDLIITNGPGTGVIVVVAALILRFFGVGGGIGSEQKGSGQMRTIFIESWARVKTLSLSGKILRPVVNRFIVQWPQLQEVLGDGVEYVGPLVT